jgi:hypothetical protein
MITVTVAGSGVDHVLTSGQRRPMASYVNEPTDSEGMAYRLGRLADWQSMRMTQSSVLNPSG